MPTPSELGALLRWVCTTAPSIIVTEFGGKADVQGDDKLMDAEIIENLFGSVQRLCNEKTHS